MIQDLVEAMIAEAAWQFVTAPLLQFEEPPLVNAALWVVAWYNVKHYNQSRGVAAAEYVRSFR